jgi:hypothetical protein
MQDALAAIDGLIAAGHVGYEVKIHQGGSRKTMVYPMTSPRTTPENAPVRNSPMAV